MRAWADPKVGLGLAPGEPQECVLRQPNEAVLVARAQQAQRRHVLREGDLLFATGLPGRVAVLPDGLGGVPQPGECLVLHDLAIVQWTAALMLPISSKAAEMGERDTRSVLVDIVRLHKMTIPMWVEVNKYKRPPFVAFIWGDVQFLGAIESVESKAVLFSREGIPKRAEVSISMLGQAFEAPAGSTALTGTHKHTDETMSPAMTLPSSDGDPRLGMLMK